MKTVLGFPLNLPVNASAHGAEVDRLIAMVHWLMLLLFVGWGIFFVYTLIRFRKKRNPKADYKGVTTHTSTYLEIGVAVIEAILLIAFSYPIWAKRVNELPSEDKATVVRVIGEQFAWNIYYAGADGKFGRRDSKLVTAENPLGVDPEDPASKDDIVLQNDLHVPVNKPVIIHVGTKDVIHSFALQQMRVKQDTIPGADIPIWFKPEMTSDQVRETMVKTLRLSDQLPADYVAMAEYKAKDDSVIVKKLDPLTDDVVAKLKESGLSEVLGSPATPMEISCAQLCGVGHYRMRGYFTVDTEEQFAKWMEEKAKTSAGSAGGNQYE